MARIPTRIVPSVGLCALSPARVAAELRYRIADGLRLCPAGDAKDDPTVLLRAGYAPRHKLELFDTTFYLSRLFENVDLRFFVGYVVPAAPSNARARAFPRIFYKDLSLVWRSASHFIWSENENWIGKGDVEVVRENGREYIVSNEATTDLPLEIQSALEGAAQQARRIPYDEDAIDLVLRRAPDDRIKPYSDFSKPRRRARSDPRNQIHGGRPVARFTRRYDPTSLTFARGFEPDLDRGVLEIGHSHSRLYGGQIERIRVLSRNRRIQYLFFAGPRQVWLIPPQATTTELTTYGVRTVDVAVPDDLCIPGYEYHFIDDTEDPPALVTQIPDGFAGAPSEIDPHRADASPWLDRLPIIRELRRKRHRLTRLPPQDMQDARRGAASPSGQAGFARR